MKCEIITWKSPNEFKPDDFKKCLVKLNGVDGDIIFASYNKKQNMWYHPHTFALLLSCDIRYWAYMPEG